MILDRDRFFVRELMLVPFYSTPHTHDKVVYRLGYVFGFRIFRYIFRYRPAP